jgi:hypothetical protein
MILVFTKPKCKDCDLLLARLNVGKIKYTHYELENNPDALALFAMYTVKNRTPLVVHNERPVRDITAWLKNMVGDAVDG